MYRIMHRKVLQVLLALALALPAGAATEASQLTAAHASGVCYWSGNIWDTVYGYPASGVTYASSVRYRIGYDCAFNRVGLNVNYFSDTLTINNSYSWVYHVSQAAAVCGYEDWYRNCLGIQWYTGGWSGGCYGSCTVWRGGYLNTWFNYDSTAALWEHWNGCDYGGFGFCETTHYFVTHQAYVYWSS
jgi:hypothetical protein